MSQIIMTCILSLAVVKKVDIIIPVAENVMYLCLRMLGARSSKLWFCQKQGKEEIQFRTAKGTSKPVKKPDRLI